MSVPATAIVLLTNIAVIGLYTAYVAAPELVIIPFLPEKSPLHRVFVYGTLKRGEPNHSLIQDASKGYGKFLGLGQTTKRYPLVIATKYNIPFLLKKPDVGNHVIGEVYDVDSKMLANLDLLEEHPSFYVRTEEEVYLAAEAKIKAGGKFNEIGLLTKTWIYFLPKFNSSLLAATMYSSYSNNGSHGLKYGESESDSAKPEDLL